MENSTEQNKEPQCYGPRRPSAKVIVMIMMVVVLILLSSILHLALFSIVVMGSAQSVVSIPEGEQKAHTHSCIAMSAKCTGNNDLFFLVVIVVIVAIVKSKVTSASD